MRATSAAIREPPARSPAEIDLVSTPLPLCAPPNHFPIVRYHALASDYDGTLASEGVVAAETFAALGRLRASGRKLILVTGRDLVDLRRVCPCLDVFDRVVAENGALLYRPGSGEEMLLAEPPPPELVLRLAARGAVPLTYGRVIVATREPYGPMAEEVIAELGLKLEIVLNAGAVMILPRGVDKRSGLAAALDELKLSLRNTVAIGDAENDQAMLGSSECAVAVANALPALKDRADLVTRASEGRGVQELADRLLTDDLRSLVVPGHALLLGERHDGTGVHVATSERRLLFAGANRGAALLVEELMARGYQCCIVDRRDHFASVEGMAGFGTSGQPPSVEETLAALARPSAHAFVSLAAVSDRPAFFAALIARLREMRERLGRPHWIVVGDAHELPIPRGLRGVLLVTPHPERLPKPLLKTIHTAIAEDPAALRALSKEASLREAQAEGEVVVWSGRRLEPLRLVSKKPRAHNKREAKAGEIALVQG
jgi:hydroxymethylpyrimidine pyrophosphatase-like HAD family hydrolase